MKCSTKRMADGGAVSAKDQKWMAEERKRMQEEEKATKAYDKAMVNTPAAPKKYAKGGEVKARGYGMARSGKKCKMV